MSDYGIVVLDLKTIIIEPDDLPHWVMERVYRLRHKVFVEGLGWTAIAKPDGRDIDEFDHLATHVILMEEDEIIGYMRLLPTTGPHLLRDVLSDLCEGPIPVGPHIWEFSRLFILKHNAGVPCAFVKAMKDWAREHGVTHFTAEVSPSLLPFLEKYGWDVKPLGPPSPIDAVAILLTVG